jgi:dTDP-4-amino-4,6-dideoxygalactose transaminase
MLRDHGSGARYHHDLIGFNARLDEIQAVVLRAKLPHLAKWNEQRREHANLYSELLKDTPVKTPEELTMNTPVYHLYVISAPKRDELQAALKEQGIFTGIHYPIPLHLQKAMAFLGYKQGDLPVTEHVAMNILSIPMFAELTIQEIEFVAKSIKTFYNSSN